MLLPVFPVVVSYVNIKFMRNMKGFIMLEVVLSAAIIALLITAAIKINTVLGKEVKIVLSKTYSLLASWNMAERDKALKSRV